MRKIYPSVRYHLDTNQSPAMIGADTFWATTGGRGDGIKIGVVDDGVDQTNPFFNPTGFTYPAGFPRGGKTCTTPKVIVARAFPGPGSGRQGRLALYRQASFHGTHVAGIAAGDAGTTARPAPTIRRSPACPESRRAPGSATTASSTCRADRRATTPSRRRSSPPSRRP